MMLVENPRGNYSFLPAIGAFSSGAVAMTGYEVVRVVLAAPVPYRKGLAGIDRFLGAQGRPPQALCGVELRSPRVMTFDEFAAFNAEYFEELKKRNIPVGGVNPVARTNVVPMVEPPSEAVLYAFSYTTPAQDAPLTFVVAGGGDRAVTGDKPASSDMIRQGDVSAEGMQEKVSYVLGLMEKRLAALGAAWPQVTAVSVYTVQNIFPLLAPLLLPRLGPAKIHGLRWHFVRPPVQGMEFEMDLSGARRLLVLNL
jgi:hypothetical protein